MKRHIFPVALILLLAGCLPTPLPPEPPAPTPEPLELVVLHTNDTWGYIFPCG